MSHKPFQPVLVAATFGAALALGASIWRPALAEPQDKPATSARIKIATVNMGEVFEKSYVRAQVEEFFQTKLKELLAKRRSELAALDQKLRKDDDAGVVPKTGPEREKHVSRRLALVARREVLEQMFVKYQNDTLKVKLKDIYLSLRDQIETFAKDNGYTLVLNVHEREFEVKSLEDFQLKGNIRQVLFHEDRSDLTGPILERVNGKAGKESLVKITTMPPLYPILNEEITMDVIDRDVIVLTKKD